MSFGCCILITTVRVLAFRPDGPRRLPNVTSILQRNTSFTELLENLSTTVTTSDTITAANAERKVSVEGQVTSSNISASMITTTHEYFDISEKHVARGIFKTNTNTSVSAVDTSLHKDGVTAVSLQPSGTNILLSGDASANLDKNGHKGAQKNVASSAHNDVRVLLEKPVIPSVKEFKENLVKEVEEANTGGKCLTEGPHWGLGCGLDLCKCSWIPPRVCHRPSEYESQGGENAHALQAYVAGVCQVPDWAYATAAFIAVLAFCGAFAVLRKVQGI